MTRLEIFEAQRGHLTLGIGDEVRQPVGLLVDSEAEVVAVSGLIRPSGSTAVASVRTKPDPPTARLPKCTRCQSLGTPFSALYSHIGETAIRFFNSRERSLSGSKSFDIQIPSTD